MRASDNTCAADRKTARSHGNSGAEVPKAYALHVSETRQGYVVYSCTAAEFHKWESRTMLRVTIAFKPVEKAVAMAKIVDALRGEAVGMAMTGGQSELMSNNLRATRN